MEARYQLYSLKQKLEIAIYKLSPEDKIILLASDGIWEVLENDQVIFLVKTKVNR